MVPVLAHGVLGASDEILFTGVAVVFLVMMGISWIRSRNMPAVEDDPEPQANPVDSPDNAASSDHFELK